MADARQPSCVETRRSRSRLGQAWRRLGPDGQLAFWLLVTLRLGLGLVAALSLMLEPPRQAAGAWQHLQIRGGEPWSFFLSSWQRWDALWYQRISEAGYRAGDNTVNFMPLYPLLVHVVSLPLRGHTVWAQLVVSSLAFFAAMWLLYRVARLDAGPLAGRLAVLLTALFPTGFFLLAPYTEGLFLALTLAAFWLARTGRPWAAGLAGLGAGLTRIFGAFLVLPLAFEYLRQRRRERKGPGLGLLASAMPLLALIGVSAYNHVVVGEQRSRLEVAALWRQRDVPFWEVLSNSWAHVTRGHAIEAVNLLCVIGFSVLALGVARRLPLAYALYVGPYLVFLLSRHGGILPLSSASRYTLILFPCLLVLALWLTRRPWLAAGWLLVSALLEALLLIHWVHWGWV